MSSGLALTSRLRNFSVWAWALGLGLLAFDFFSLPIFRWRASAAYILFGLATGAVAWAEKREFSTRVFIYRLHDAVIFSPWKYLLLYFLWVSVYSPFTEYPLASLVYATNGWMSLLLIGLSAQFIFCERNVRGVLLLPARLAIAFWVYSLTLSMLMSNTLLHIFLPGFPFSPLAAEQANLFFYFLMGLPFLLWDFVKDGRRLLPRTLSLFTIWSGTITVMLIGRRLYHVALALILSGVLGFFLFKRLRPHKPLLLGFGAAGCAVAMAAGLAYFLRTEAPWEAALASARIAVEDRVRATFSPAWEALRQSHFLGRGVGVTDLRGVWKRVTAEAGLVGALFYSGFFLALLWDLYQVRHSQRVVVSNIAFLSVAVFLVILSHFVENPYGAYVWVWYGLWALFASTPKKKGSVSP